VSGSPASFASSEHGKRWFCPVCGTPLHYTDPRSDYVGVAIGTLDEAESVAPQIHQWTGSQLAWFEIADDLPRVLEGTLPHPAKRTRDR
jgi:hypothetical protein